MIEKLVHIRNTGKLKNLVPRGDVAFRKLNLIYALNGRGKTTIADILRSYQSGDPDYIMGRKTLGVAAAPDIELRISNGSARFTNASWDRTEGRINVFGDEFIEQNVYTGKAIGHEHKKNMYRVIVGAEGVRLARRVDELDGLIRDAQAELTTKRTELLSLVPDEMEFDAFVALPPRDDVEMGIANKEREVSALREADTIARKSELTSLSLPVLPANFEGILKGTVEDMVRDAEQRIRSHLETHTNGATESWISEGIRYQQGDLCPYCGQSLKDIDLVAVYRDFFSAAYRSLRESVDALSADVSRIAEDAAVLRIGRAISDNAHLTEFWKRFVGVELPELSEAVAREGLEALRDAAAVRIAEKQKNVLDPQVADEKFATGIAPYNALASVIETYNKAVGAANEAIRSKKEATKSGNLANTETELVTLKGTRARYSTDGCAKHDAYRTVLDRKTQLEQQKVEAKRALDENTDEIITRWEADLNTLLQRFGAGFQIGGASRRYVGGSPSSTYHILINNSVVELGDEGTARNVPSFANTLSAGDRATLGLAFFVVTLQQAADLAERIIVFDDPFSSLDRSRRSYTQQCICRFARSAKQVIVMSHDAGFLKLISENYDPPNTKSLRFNTIVDTTYLEECDLEAETQSSYQQDYLTLQKFVDENAGAPRTVARSIRPVLEGMLRNRFPGSFATGMQLGNMIAAIRGSTSPNSLVAAKPMLPELDDINAFSRLYHHDNWETEPIDENELQAFVMRTLVLVRS